jgi:O-antigen ligase
MNRVLELVLAVTIVGATLAFGGVQPLTYTLMEFALFLAVLLLLWKQTRQGEISIPLPLWPVLFALWAIVQLVPLPSFFIGWISPARLLDPTLSGLSQGQWVWSTLSIYPHDTALGLGKFLAYLGAFALAAYLFDSGKRKSTLIRALIFLGCFEACYGIVQYLTGWQKIFTYTKVYNLSEATGTYINRNHFAGLLELILPFAVAAGFYSFQIWSERKQAGLDRRASAERSSAGMRTIFYLFLVVIIFVAVVFSRSRGGIMATVFSIVFIALLAQLKTRRKIWALAIFLFLVCVIGYGLWIGLDPVLARFEQLREPGYLQLEGRIAIWKDSLRLVRDHPLVGTGLGTFGTVFRRYQTDLVGKYVDHAHNDYLEFAADTGLLGAALLFLPILYLLAKMIASFLNDTRRYRRAVTLGCIGSTLALLIHSVTDFNLQIPANALVFAVVLGIGYKAACVERREEERTNARAAPVARG